MTAISSYVGLYCVLGALCYVCVPKIDKLTIWTFQLELVEFDPGLEPLEFVSGECSSNSYNKWSVFLQKRSENGILIKIFLKE